MFRLLFKSARCPYLAAKSLSFYLAVPFLLSSCADLAVKDVDYGPFTGANLVMKGTVKNEGQKQAGASTTSVQRKYAWSDPYIDTARMPTPALNAGDDAALPLWVFSPTELPEPGMCMHVRVCADADNVVDEQAFGVSKEGNNCLVKSFMNKRYCRGCDQCCNQTLPQTYDWRSVNGTNWVTGVRDQQNCGSCWAFSAVAAVEAKYNVERSASQLNPIDLSEQELVSCPGGGGTCLGGWSSTALGYIRTTNDIVGENTLSYTSTNCLTNSGGNQVCSAACTSAGQPGCANPILTAAQCSALGNPATPSGANPPQWRIGSRHKVAGNSVDDTKRALLCHGPLSVCGTWSIDANGNRNGHCVLLVGWDSNGWIIKNSWGTGWHSQGYDPGYGSIPFSGHTFSNLVNDAWYAQDVTARP